jgi:hypothetical protein
MRCIPACGSSSSMSPPTPPKPASEITSASGDVDLYVQYGLPITNYSLLLPPAFDVLYTNNPVVGGGLEAVCLLTNSGPVTLRQGTYYLAVVNRETNDVAFCVRAYELLENAIVYRLQPHRSVHYHRVAQRRHRLLSLHGFDFGAASHRRGDSTRMRMSSCWWIKACAPAIS